MQLADPTLVFVYNADGGLFNILADIGHKIFSPHTYRCDLCQLTHGYFGQRKAWQSFVDNLPITSEYLHRDQFRRQFPHLKSPLPAIYLREGKHMKLCVAAASLAECQSLDDLKGLIVLVLSQTNNEGSHDACGGV